MPDLHKDHFRMLRLARLRQLKVKRLRPGVYAVSSHSRKGHWHKVAQGLCSCEAQSYCTHTALALDEMFTQEATPAQFVSYHNAQRNDFKEMELRVLRGEETAEDRRYARPAVQRIRARLEEEEAPKKDYATTF